MDALMRRDERSRMADDGLLSLGKAMDRLFERSLVTPFPAEYLAGDLALDMYETDDELVVKMAVPGVKPDQIEVTVVGKELSIKGETKAEEDAKERSYIRRERRYGRFARSLTLPDYVQADRATAEFERGVLTLKMPKTEGAKVRTVPVKTKA